jgi:hypothetical protein
MPIAINGSGSISGISVGGLPDGVITIDELGANEKAGLCKAWVNFNGTGTVAIRASYNVSSITDNGVGDYTVNFTTALADANYSVVATGGNDLIAATDPVRGLLTRSLVTTSCRIIATRTDSVAGDTPINSVAIFR